MFGKQNIIQVKSDNFEFMLWLMMCVLREQLPFIEPREVNFDWVTEMNNSWNHNFFTTFFRFLFLGAHFFHFKRRKTFSPTLFYIRHLKPSLGFCHFPSNFVVLLTADIKIDENKEQSWNTVNCSVLNEQPATWQLMWISNKQFFIRNYVSCQCIKLVLRFGDGMGMVET